MNVVLNEKALYIVFPVDDAHVDSSLADLSLMLKNLTETEMYTPICKGLLAIKKNRGERENNILQSTATKGIKKL